MIQNRVSGKHTEIGEALQERVRGRLSGAIAKYFDRAADANVTFTKERGILVANCSAHLSSGPTMQAHGEGSDAYLAFEVALEHLEKQVRRYTRRLKNHHERRAPDSGLALSE